MIPVIPHKNLERSLRPTLSSTGKIQESRALEKRGLLAGAAHPSEDVAWILDIYWDPTTAYETHSPSDWSNPGHVTEFRP